jgi:hypothetical protein
MGWRVMITHKDHIYGHIEKGHIGQYWKMAIKADMVRLYMTIIMVFSKISKNAYQQPTVRVLANIGRVH